MMFYSWLLNRFLSTVSLGFLLSTPLTLAILAAPAYAQSGQSVLDGVYNSQQARSGARVYRRICAECHEGDEPDADPIIGLTFIERWRAAPLEFLYNFISTEMPGDDPGELKEKDYLDVTAFLLQANDYPEGNSALETQHLGSIQLTGMDGPQPIPRFSLVKVVGCLQQTESWMLSQASTMMRVRTADETTSDELAASGALPAGQQRYTLTSAENFSASELEGARVQVKGVLKTHDNPVELTVLSMGSVDGKCDI